MSENLQNIYHTAIGGGGYISGSGVLNVVAAPTTGDGTYTMTLVIRDQTTNVVKLLFRVTSVTGTALTGASEGADANANAGDFVDGSMISVASQGQLFTDHHGYGTFANLPATTGRATGDRYKCSDSAYDMVFNGSIWVPTFRGIPCTRPDISTFTLQGSTPQATDNTRGPFVIRSVLGGSGYKWSLYTKAKPGTNYTVTVGFRGFTSFQASADQAYICAVLRKTSSGQFWAYGQGDNANDVCAIFFTDPTTYGGSNPLSAVLDTWGYAQDRFVRIVGDGTNWTLYIGFAGAVDPSNSSNTNWWQVFQHGQNTTITPDEVGFGICTHAIVNAEQFVEFFHFSATSP